MVEKKSIFDDMIPAFEQGNLRITKVVQYKTKDHVFIEEKHPDTGEWAWEFRWILGKGFRIEDLPIAKFWEGDKIVPPPRKYWFRIQHLANNCKCGRFKSGYYFSEGYKNPNPGGKSYCGECDTILVFLTVGRGQFPRHPKTMTDEEKKVCYDTALKKIKNKKVIVGEKKDKVGEFNT